MPLKPTSITEYLAALPADRRQAVEALRTVLREKLPAGFHEEMNYGMIGYVVPHRLYPKGYHGKPTEPLPFMNIASQKNFIAIYHMGLYADSALYDWFLKEHQLRVTTKADIGKSCIRYGHSAVLPLELIGELMTKMSPQQWIELYEATYKKQANKR